MAFGAEGLRASIPSLRHAAAITHIAAGYSLDRKYLVQDEAGRRRLLRIASRDRWERKREEFSLLQELSALGAFVPTPLEAGVLGESGYGYYIVSYLDGEDGATALPRLSREDQYAIGVEAGEDLARMHRLLPRDTLAPWAERCGAKHRATAAAYRQCGVRFRHDEEASAFVDANIGHLQGRPTRFQHGDFHVQNIIVRGQHYAGAIDFDRRDWGDPYQEFMKVAFFSSLTSAAFANGQVRGYFGGAAGTEPPAPFWRLYALYVAMSMFGSIVWALRRTPDELPDMIDYIDRVMEDHRGFASVRPRWWQP